MAEYNIAQIGTFDYENIGDLLFPTVLEAQLKKRMNVNNLFLFSLNGCTRPLDSENKEVYSIDKLEEIHLSKGIDAIILGGGDLIRFDNNIVATNNYSSENTAFDLIFYPFLIANKYNIPLLWNCPGVPFEFTDDDKIMLKEYLEQVDYISVRDNKSKSIIAGTGTKKAINVFPDSVLSISELVDVKEASKVLKARYEFLKDKYIVFQSFPPLNDAYKPLLIEQLKMLAESYNMPIIMFPIGRVHNDHVFLKELTKDLDDDRFIYIEEKLNLTESCALLSDAQVFIGTSLHGNIIANSYGTPSIALDAGDLIKVRNSFKILDREKYCIKDISSLKDTVDKVLKEPKLERLLPAIGEVNKHFDNLCAEVTKKQKKPSFMEALRKTYYHQNQTKQTLTFYFDCGEGFSQDNIYEVPYYEYGLLQADVSLPENCQAVRIDPAESIFTIIKDLKISLDDESCNYTHNGIEDNDIYFYTSDPQLFIDVKNKHQLTISFIVEAMPHTYPEKLLNSFSGLPEKAQMLEKNLADTLTHVRNLEAIIAQKEQVISEKQNHIDTLEQDVANRDTIISEMKNSTSWKITAPLRKIKGGKK